MPRSSSKADPPDGTSTVLSYVSDAMPGIVRRRAGHSSQYFAGGRPVRGRATLARIKRLAIPPAWTRVWICPHDRGHLQATGMDAAGRKQYRYHSQWTARRDKAKFLRIKEFGRHLHRLRQQVRRDLARPGWPQEKVLATVVSLMERTHARVGDPYYAKRYGSLGITTMRDHHVRVNGDPVRFTFTGKKGVEHDIALRSARLARIVRSCKEIPGKQLFQYYDPDGTRRAIDPGMVNDYIREASGADFTSKDLRTWMGTVHCVRALREPGRGHDPHPATTIVLAVDDVARELGNTRAVCRRHYIHPLIPDLYERGDLQPFLFNGQGVKAGRGLSANERTLLKVLRTARSNSRS